MVQQYEEKMKKSLDSLYSEFSTIRAGRANPHVLDKITVDYYGTQSTLQQVANVSVPEPRMIQIQPWEASLIKEIEKAILCSDLGLTPNNDGKAIRLVFPDAFKKMNKANEVSEDELKQLEEKIQKLTDKYVAEVDKAVDEKTKEIMTV